MPYIGRDHLGGAATRFWPRANAIRAPDMTDTTDIKHPTILTSGTPADFTEAGEPFALFGAWFSEACKAEPNDPNAMALATVDENGLPDVRMVLMKGYDAAGFVFYSHIASQKGRELAANPKAALVFHWKSLHRQVRIRGLFRDTAEAGADRRLGQQAVAAARKPLCLRTGDRQGRGQIPDRRGAASARVERLAHRARAVRVLARPSVPPARPHRIPPRRSRSTMVQDAALSLSAMSPG
jgi:hypothetical protein